MPFNPATLRQALTAATARLAAREDLTPEASRDAEHLLLHTLAAPRTLLFTDPDRTLTQAELSGYNAAIGRRLTGEPIQYITGQQEFYGLALRVTPAVLIPRPETELLVEAVLDRLPHSEPLRIVDIGTGSGAIAIAVARHLPQARLTALDISSAGLEVASANAIAHGLEARIRFLESDLLAAVASEAPFDAILSNPPYIPDEDRETLHPQVRDHEPATALFAGREGLDIYRRLIPQACDALKPEGLLALEIGHGQRESIAALLSTWEQIEFLHDLQQIPRVVLARKPGVRP